MKLLILTCQHCAAPLEVPARTSQFRCLYCGSQLHVQWSESAAGADAVDRSANRASRLVKTPEQLKREEEIHLLDYAWDQVRRRFMVRNLENQLRVPNKNNLQVARILGVLLGIAATVMGGGAVLWAPDSRASGNTLFGCFLVLLGVLTVVATLAWYRRDWKKAEDFEVHQHAYQSERQRLLAELEQLPHALAEPNVH